jgi:hypothetical protein
MCGRANFYALKDKVERFHPQNGIRVECNQYRCRGCNGYFDDMQWMYNCQAPTALQVQSKVKKELVREQWRKRAMSMEPFDENMKRAFRKHEGVGYDDFMQILRRANDLRVKGELKKLEQAKPGPVVISTNTKTLSPYDAHLEMCNICMCADTKDQHCDAGKILLDLKNKGA